MVRFSIALFTGLFLWVGFSQPQAQAACEKSHVFLILDTSGSMRGTKHTTVRTAIKTLMTNFGTKMRFGLATFGATYQLRVPISDNAYQTIRSNVDSYPSNENYTRMGDAIRAAGLYMGTLKNAEPAATRKRPYYLVLLTDGNPTGSTLVPGTEAQTVWTRYKIPTYAIGIQFNASVLNDVAVKGQTTQAYNASNQTSLNNVFNLIANTATTEVCDNLDNDCDGQTDEGLRRNCSSACGAGQETCVRGAWVNCSARQPTTEKCDGIDNDCDGRIDENWALKGRSCTKGQGRCKSSGVWRCNSAKTNIECSATTIPPQAELCDGIDNDCDGQVDENFANKGKTCTGGSGACKQSGKYVCTPDGKATRCSAPGGTPKPEVCDGLDNDCDGKIDESLTRRCTTACGDGLETCKAGKWIGCTARQPGIETCNNVDDNCDGQTDEKLKRKCTTGCGDGNETCIAGRWDFCDAQKPETEICDGIDNDCDGKIDNLPAKKCQGGCGEGLAVCTKGVWSGCSGPAPETEVCDGKDNDCDGLIDNDLYRECKTPCGSGRQQCEVGQWGACSAPRVQPELCNGKDDNCDGDVDEKAPCPSGTVCKQGACRPKCRNGECPSGLQCGEDDICIGDPCATVKCEGKLVCQGGRCIDLCTVVTCDTGLKCSNGQCVPEDCYITGCPSGTICKEGKCDTDPCAQRKCPTGQFCRVDTDGKAKCVLSCANVNCKDDETCTDGRCQADPKTSGPCADVTCPTGQFCDQGVCVGDPCYGVNCAVGRACKDGKCEIDPCVNINCPNGESCEDGQCGRKTPAPPKPDGDPGEDKPGDIDAGVTDTPGGKPDDGTSAPDTIELDTGTGTNNNDKGPGTGEPPACSCQGTSGLPLAPIMLLFLFGLVLRRQRVPAPVPIKKQ